MSVYLCETPVFRDGRVPVVQRAGHAAHRHPAGAVGGHARRLWSGRAAARPPAATLAARPEPATRITFNMHTLLIASIQYLDFKLLMTNAENESFRTCSKIHFKKNSSNIYKLFGL